MSTPTPERPFHAMPMPGSDVYWQVVRMDGDSVREYLSETDARAIAGWRNADHEAAVKVKQLDDELIALRKYRNNVLAKAHEYASGMREETLKALIAEIERAI